MTGAIRDGVLKTSVFMITVLMILSFPKLVNDENTPEILVNEVFETDGRQMDQLAEACEGLTFEDIFAYTHARFDVQINSDWKSADIRAIAWINDEDAGVVRSDIDELMAELPGNDASDTTNPTASSAQGNDGYVSTDERSALKEVGPDCVSVSDTRFGAYHPHHRGGQNWNNMSWTDETVLLSDENYTCVESVEASGEQWNEGDCVQTLIHPDDPLIDDCDQQRTSDSNCKWVPVESEYDFIVWLDGELNFNEVDFNNFTLSIAGTNVTSADLVITYPANSFDLRFDGSYEEIDCDVTYTETDEDADDYGTTYSPTNCLNTQSEDTREYTMQAVDGGTKLQFHTLLTYERQHWPAEKTYFIDFTTAPPEVDDPPVWTSDAPNVNTIIPIKSQNEYQIIVDSSTLNSWGNDDNGAATFNCTSSIITDLTTDSKGNLVGTPTAQEGTITCSLVDAGGQTSVTTNTWKIQQIMNVYVDGLDSSSGSALVDQEISIEVFEQDIGDLSFSLVGWQDGTSTAISGCATTGATVAGLSPGDYTLEITVEGNSIITWTSEWDLQLSKSSQPPQLVVSGGEWADSNNDGLVDKYTLTGSFSDPDGEDVTFTITLDGIEAGSITPTGTTWSSAPIPFDLYSEGMHNITITACDESGICVSESKNVENLYFAIADIVDNNPDVVTIEGEEGLPNVGIVGTILSIISAVLVISNRRKK